MSPDGDSHLDYGFGLVWAMVITPIAAGVRGFTGGQWFLLLPTIPLLGFFLGWLTAQYRRADVAGARRRAWLTVHQRQSWYKRVRLLAGWLFLQSMAVFLVLTAIRGDGRLLVLLGLGLGAATAAVVGLTWWLGSERMEQEGWRW